ncbi:hypothetical protein BC629DRAFT_531457 [Irpex lacteus]|nr:hypothetical protein BC629DRAFT_531457 [Irpex lacteus]
MIRLQRLPPKHQSLIPSLTLPTTDVCHGRTGACRVPSPFTARRSIPAPTLYDDDGFHSQASNETYARHHAQLLLRLRTGDDLSDPTLRYSCSILVDGYFYSICLTLKLGRCFVRLIAPAPDSNIALEGRRAVVGHVRFRRLTHIALMIPYERIRFVAFS